MRAARWLVTPVAVLALAGACGGDGDDDIGSDTVPTRPATTTTSTSVAGEAPPANASTTPVSVPPSEPRFLSAVRVAGHGSFDRVVFEFENGAPGYAVKYVQRPIVEDGSGAEVAVQGSAVIEVRMEHASGADLQGENVRQTYTGPRRVRGDTDAVTEVVRSGDFEGVLHWVIGVRSQRPYAVRVVEGDKLVIDVVV